MKLLITHGTVIPVEPARLVLEDADIYIEGDRIVAVAPAEPPWPAAAADKVLDARGCYVLPGFVNGHGHLSLALFRGLGEFVPGQGWADHFTRQALLGGRVGEEEYTLAAQVLIAEMLRAGITSFADIHYEPPGAPPVTEWIATAAEAAGIRAGVCLETQGYLSEGGTRLRYVPDEAVRTFANSVAFAQRWQGRGQGRMTAMLGLANPPVPMRADLERVARGARDTGLGIQLHVAEIAHEMWEWQQLYGQSPTEVLRATGVLNHHVLGGNVVFMDGVDAEVLRDHDFHASTCPQNCAKLTLGMLDIPLLLEQGVNVCLGTNEVVNNNNLDMLEEMRFAALYHKLRQHDPSTLWGDAPLRLITERGGRALGTGVGVLAAGRPADIILMDARGPHLHPAHDHLANIIFAAASADTRTVIIAGQVVMEDRRLLTLDDAAIIARLEERLAPLRAGLPDPVPGTVTTRFELKWEVDRA